MAEPSVTHLASHVDPSRPLTRDEAITLLSSLPEGAVVLDGHGFLAVRLPIESAPTEEVWVDCACGCGGYAKTVEKGSQSAGDPS